MLVDSKLHQEIDNLIATYPDWQQRIGNINPWLYGDYAQLYVRLGSARLIDGIRYRVLDVSSVEVKEKYRGQGVFTNLLSFLENKELPIYIENVLEPRLSSFLERRGYLRIDTPGYANPPSYFAIVS